MVKIEITFSVQVDIKYVPAMKSIGKKGLVYFCLNIIVNKLRFLEYVKLKGIS